MNDPPTPIKPGDWATVLALLVLVRVKADPSGADLYRLKHSVTNATTYLAAVNAMQWLLSTTAPSNGVVETLMLQSTYDILKNGTTNTNGTVTYLGTTYTIKLYWDGANVTCKAV
jgi:hypothetical protein